MTQQSVDRRTILKTSAAVAAAGPFAGLVAAGRGAQAAHARPLWRSPTRATARCGCTCRRLPLPLVPRHRGDRHPERRHRPAGSPRWHGRLQGPDGTVILVRNHEVNNPVPAAFGPGTPYDPRPAAARRDPRHRHGEVINAFTSLNGTMMNCSGGIMPWGSWVTCEETVNGPDVGADFTGASNVR